MSVTEWCRENNIPVITYWNRQRKVFEAFSKDTANVFVEVTVQPEIGATNPIAVTISSGNFTAINAKKCRKIADKNVALPSESLQKIPVFICGFYG